MVLKGQVLSNLFDMTSTPYQNILIWNVLVADSKHTQWLGKNNLKYNPKDICVSCDQIFSVQSLCLDAGRVDKWIKE